MSRAPDPLDGLDLPEVTPRYTVEELAGDKLPAPAAYRLLSALLAAGWTAETRQVLIPPRDADGRPCIERPWSAEEDRVILRAAETGKVVSAQMAVRMGRSPEAIRARLRLLTADRPAGNGTLRRPDLPEGKPSASVVHGAENGPKKPIPK